MFKFDKSTGEIFIYDEIGPEWWGCIDDGMVIDALEQLEGKRALVRINSPGGSCDIGVSIYNALERYEGGVDTFNDSCAASISSYIFMVGENRTIAKNAKVMIHSPWCGVGWGNANELRKIADTLDKYEESMLEDHAKLMDISTDEVRQLLNDETWYLAEDAIEVGIATAIGDSSSTPTAKIAAGRYKNTPKDLIDPNPKKVGSRMQVAASIKPLEPKTKKPDPPKTESVVDAAAKKQMQVRQRLAKLA